MAHQTTNGGGLEQVRDGMEVVDSGGEAVGTVASIRMGDPDAVTAEGQDLDYGGGDELPPGARERLLRVGYLAIKGRGPFSGTRYAAADEVDRVSGDTVHLSVSKGGLLH